MNKLIVAICFGASALAVQLPAVATTTVVKRAVPAATTPVATNSISPTASSTPVGVPNANNAGGNNPNNNNANSGTGWVNPTANGPQLGNGCNASGNVPKKCKPPSGS